MSFLEPGNLAWLGLLPLLLALYVMKLRRREVLVTASFLWQKAAREARVDSFFHRLRINIFLILQLLALGALAAGLARPFTLAPGQLASQVVLLLDCSASMQARFEGGSRFEAARRRARQIIRQAPESSEVMLVALGAQARVLVGFTTDRSRLLRELDRLEPQDTEADLAAVRPLTLSVTLSKPKAEILLLGDTLPEGALPPNLRFLGFGEEGRNLALSAFQVFERAGQRQAFIAVTSYSAQAENVTLQLYRGGRLQFSRPLQVAARSRRTLTLLVPDSAGDEPYELRLASDDDLAADNRFWSLAPRQSVQRVQLVGPVSRFVEKAFVAQPRARVQRVAEPSASPALTVWENPPERLPAGVHLLLHPPPSWRGSALPGVEPLVLDEHALVRGLPLDRSLVGGRQRVRCEGYRQEVLASAGGEPALWLLRGPESQAVLLAFDLDQSDLVLAPAFPMLIARILEQLVAGSLDSAAESLLTGQELSLRSPSPMELVDPAGGVHTLTPRQGRCSTLETTRAGLYQLRSGSQSRPLAVNLVSARESALTAAPADTGGIQAGATSMAQSPSMLEEYWQELAGAALLCLWLEWFLYWGGPRGFRRGN